MEEQIYEERRASSKFRRRLGLAVLLCMFGCVAYFGFLSYRHLHPMDQKPVEKEVLHTGCPHIECKNAHKKIERPEEYAPSLLGALLIVYCAAVGVGAFIVEIPE